MNAPSLFTAAETSAVEPRPLRPHQRQAMALLSHSYLAGKRRPVLQMPTGAGKTRTAAEIVRGALAKGKRVVFTVPAISLIDQTVEAFEQEGIDWIGVIQAQHERTDWRAPVQVASVQTLTKRKLPAPDVVIVDECHQQHRVIARWMKLLPDALFIGLSATPWAKGMAEHWDDLLVPVSMRELIEAGFLSDMRVFCPSHPDLSGVKVVKGDYAEKQLGEVMSETRLVADIVQTWRERAQGLPTLVFAVDRAHARKVQAEFAAAGIRMGYCDADVELEDRKALFDEVAAGELAGIVNIGTLTTGVDADIRCVVMARPTKSEMLFVQCIGRGLRTAPGKSALPRARSQRQSRAARHGDGHSSRRIARREGTATGQARSARTVAARVRKLRRIADARAVQVVRVRTDAPVGYRVRERDGFSSWVSKQRSR